MSMTDGKVTWPKVLIAVGLSIGVSVGCAFALFENTVSGLAFDLLRGDIKRIELKIDDIVKKVEALDKE